MRVEYETEGIWDVGCRTLSEDQGFGGSWGLGHHLEIKLMSRAHGREAEVVQSVIPLALGQGEDAA